MFAFFGFPSSAKNDDFRCLEGTFRHLLAPWNTILLTWGAQGAPRKTPGDPEGQLGTLPLRSAFSKFTVEWLNLPLLRGRTL